MNPLILSALIGMGGNVIGSLFSGKEKSKDRQYNTQQNTQLRNPMLSGMKPQTPYYQSPYMGGMNDTLMKLIMGNIGTEFGNETLGGYGIDFNNLTNLDTLKQNLFPGLQNQLGGGAPNQRRFMRAGGAQAIQPAMR